MLLYNFLSYLLFLALFFFTFKIQKGDNPYNPPPDPPMERQMTFKRINEIEKKGKKPSEMLCKI